MEITRRNNRKNEEEAEKISEESKGETIYRTQTDSTK